MAFELVSGPDLGGGFLFQLTAEPVGDRTRVIYHAQEGGIDASGPPKGSLHPFGFAPAASACPIGGRECLHRTFEIPPAGLGLARLAYNRFRFVSAALLEQHYGGAPVPWSAALGEIVHRLAVAFPESPGRWAITGPASAWLQGGSGPPQELDLSTDPEGVDTIGSALQEFLVEPVAETAWEGIGRVRGGRAYVGTLRAGARVRFGIGATSTPGPAWGDVASDVRSLAVRLVPSEGGMVPASRLEYAMVRAALARDRPSEAAIAAALRISGADLPQLDRWLAEAGVAGPEAARVREILRDPVG